MIAGISAVTLATHDMRAAVRFYRLVGLALRYGGEEAGFTSFRLGDSGNFLNLIAQPVDKHWTWWGRLILYDPDLDDLYARLIAAGCRIAAPPRDAEWGERFFHVSDPDGHELSIAWPLDRPRPGRLGDPGQDGATTE